MSKIKAEPSGINCPKCGSSKTIKRGSPIQRKHSIAQPCGCQECGKYFTLDATNCSNVVLRKQVRPAGINCPKCGSSQTVKCGRSKQHEYGLVQTCKCKECNKYFTLGGCKKGNPGSTRKTTKLANKNCPRCGSSKTIKNGSPIQYKHGLVQPCRCKECNKVFSLNKREKLKLYLHGKLIHTFCNSKDLKHVDNVKCPNCKQEKAVLKTNFYDNTENKRLSLLICLGCGQEFKGEGRPWANNTCRKLGQTIPHQPWQFQEDKWDSREIYPNINEYKSSSLFINFSNCGSNWFKDLLKTYILWRIESGIKFSTISRRDCLYLKRFGRFLEQEGVSSMLELNRQMLAIFYNQKLSHLKVNVLYGNINCLDNFFVWGNQTENFITSCKLITTFDYPKLFYNEPDPLEELVLNSIRDNLHILPEPIQLMFMLGLWLGTRPGELCFISKDCLKLDPDGSKWWVEFEREKISDEHRLPITTDLVRLIQKQKIYINELFGEDYSYLFCHYQEIGKTSYPNYPRIKPIKRPPIVTSSNNPMVKFINCLIEKCNIQDSNGKLVRFTGAILRPSRATHLINNGFSLNFVRIWLKHRSAGTTKKYYTRYKPGQMLDVAAVMANLDQKFYPYDSNPESLRQNPELHELDGLKMLNGEPLYGYCSFREFCPRFGRCYTCGFHVASADKLSHYKSQLEQLKIKEEIAFNHGSSEIYESYQQIVNALESIIDALERADE